MPTRTRNFLAVLDGIRRNSICLSPSETWLTVPVLLGRVLRIGLYQFFDSELQKWRIGIVWIETKIRVRGVPGFCKQ
jgi:hypothetical protein